MRQRRTAEVTRYVLFGAPTAAFLVFISLSLAAAWAGKMREAIVCLFLAWVIATAGAYLAEPLIGWRRGRRVIATIAIAVIVGIVCVVLGFYEFSLSASADPAPGTTINNQGIITHGQTGGTNIINREPNPPRLSFGESSIVSNPDGTVTETIPVEIISYSPPGQIYLEAHAPGIVSFDMLPQRAGMMMYGPGGVRPDFAFTTIMQPFGKYIASVRLKAPAKVELRYQFN